MLIREATHSDKLNQILLTERILYLQLGIQLITMGILSVITVIMWQDTKRNKNRSGYKKNHKAFMKNRIGEVIKPFVKL